MTAPGREADPAEVATPEEFVAMLRRLRDLSGLTYRMIARRAAANGDVLPASTLATMLTRRTLPRRELVVSLLRACEVPPEQFADCLATWKRLTAAGPPVSFDPPPPPALLQLVSRPSVAHAAVPFQLPPLPAALVGRTEETALIRAAVAQPHAVCVLEGPGGIGKSALALHEAHRIVANYPGGCLYADLHGASGGIAPATPAEILARFLRALGSTAVASSVEESSAEFRTLTAAAGVLVVLDNVATAAQVRPLIATAAGCATLITSRWKLPDLDCTARIPIGPLSDEASLAVLSYLCGTDRIRADPAAAAVLVRRCAGLPLALRIAGARAATRPEGTLAGLAERLDDERQRLDELAVGDLSVRTCLDLGYHAFTEAGPDGRGLAARLFHLAALPDWGDLGAAACASLVDVRVIEAERALDQLAGAHLLEPTLDGRYRFHDVVRLYARERGHAVEPAADRTAAMGRLATWLLTMATRAHNALYPHDPPPGQPAATGDGAGDGAVALTPAEAWTWFEREHTNLLMIARQLMAAGQCFAEVRDLALTGVKFITVSGYAMEQEQFGRLAVEAADRLGDKTGSALALKVVAVAMLQQGRPREAVPLLERSLRVHRDLGDRLDEAACLNNLGNALRDLGDVTDALAHLQAALAIRQELGPRSKEASTLDNIGLAHQLLGDYRQAITCHTAALTISRELGDRHLEGLILLNLAETWQLAREHQRAARHAHEALVICREFQHQRGIGIALRILGDTCAGTGQGAAARAYWEQALGLLDGVDRDDHGKVLAALRHDQSGEEPPLEQP
jgi:tetratricopeptide (TPR) repeat protein